MKLFYHVSALFIALAIQSCADNSTDSTPAGKGNETSAPPERTERSERRVDTEKTSVTIGPDGGSVKTRSGTSASVDSSGVRMEQRKVRVEVKRD